MYTSNTCTYYSVLVATMKHTDTDNLWMLGIRHCSNGKSIIAND